MVVARQEAALLNSYQVSQRAKPAVADAADNDQVFGAAERAELFAVLDDSFGQALADAGERFQFVCRGGVDVDGFLLRGCGRLLIVRLPGRDLICRG